MSTAQNELSIALFFLTAMCMAGVIHVWWLKSYFSQRWRQPLDGGRSLRGRRLLGDNKMLRGFMVLPLSAAFIFPLLLLLLPDNAVRSIDSLASSGFMQLSVLGFASGFGFMLGELPNSFIKRQLDIAPGTAAESQCLRIIFAFVDRVDSTVVALLFASLVIPLSALTCFWVLILGFVLHALFSLALHKVGVKNRAL